MSGIAILRGIGVASLALVVLSGCGGGAEGYHVTGNVTFEGKPVPQGKIYFTPDSSKGNSGATGYAVIEDGAYDTSAEGGRPVVGGAMIVRIEGQDPSASAAENPEDTSGEKVIKTLFANYETAAELPKENTTQDFEVPPEAAQQTYQGERPVVVP